MTFDEFLPQYLEAHSKPATRLFHAAGSLAGLTLLGAAVVKRDPKLAMLALAAGYGPAWFSHFAIEGNTPKTFGYPMYSLRGDFVMLGRTLRGQLA